MIFNLISLNSTVNIFLLLSVPCGLGNLLVLFVWNWGLNNDGDPSDFHLKRQNLSQGGQLLAWRRWRKEVTKSCSIGGQDDNFSKNAEAGVVDKFLWGELRSKVWGVNRSPKCKQDGHVYHSIDGHLIVINSRKRQLQRSIRHASLLNYWFQI